MEQYINLRQLLKVPKLYFFDTGLVAYLTSYLSPEILMNGALNGAILENYVVAELRKSYLNHGAACPMYYYRDSNAKEIDVILESNGQLHPMEIKKSTHPAAEITRIFKVLDKATLPRGRGAVLALTNNLCALDRDNLLIPIGLV